MSMPPYGIKPGRRQGRPAPVRRPCWHALGWTVLSAVVPGSGFPAQPPPTARRPRPRSSPRRPHLGRPSPPRTTCVRRSTSPSTPSRLTRAAIVTAVCLVLWVAVVVGTFVVLRPTPGRAALAPDGRQRARRRAVPGRRRAGRALRPRRVRPGPRRERGLHAQPDGHPAAGVKKEDPWHGRHPGQRAAARRRLRSVPGGHADRHDDAGLAGHPHRPHGHLRPAPQPDERAVPGRQPAARGLPRTASPAPATRAAGC